MTQCADGAVGLIPRIIAGVWFGVAALIPCVPFVVIAYGGSNRVIDPRGLFFFFESPAAIAAFFGFSIGARIVDPKKRISSFRATLCGLLVGVLSLVVYLGLYVLGEYAGAQSAPYPAAASKWVLHLAPIIVGVGSVIMILPVSIVGSFAGWLLFRWSRRRETAEWLKSFPRIVPAKALLFNAMAFVIAGVSCLIAVYLFAQVQP
jgi:hypothetical protein